MADAPLRIDRDARGVLTLTLSRPAQRNALSAQLVDALTAAARAVDDGVRCVILAGKGDVFCAGADIREMRDSGTRTADEARAEAVRFSDMLAALDAIPAPLLSRVQGVALGGGAALAVLADVAVAEDGASLAFTETRVGILPATIAPYVVRRTGSQRAAALFASALRIDAVRARELGLVEVVAPAGGLDDRVAEWVDGFLSTAPGAAREAKRLARLVADFEPGHHRALLLERNSGARSSDEGREGLGAFLEKREPRWRA